MKINSALKMVTVVGLLLAIPAQAVIVYNNPAALTGNELLGAPLRLGMDFQVNGPGTVSVLGAFDDGLDGFNGIPVEVGIFNLSDNSLVASAIFSGSSYLYAGSSAIQAIAPVILGVGTYSIVASSYGNIAGPLERNYSAAYGPSGTPPTFNTAGGYLTRVGHREDIGEFGLAVPAGPIFVLTDPAFAAGTFDFTPVPEAETFALVAVGLLGLVYIGRNYFAKQRVA